MSPKTLLILAISAASLFACKRDQSLTRGNQVAVQVLSEPDNLHPTNGRSGTRVNTLFFTNQKLTEIDPTTGEQKPVLAASLPIVSADGLQYTYEMDPAAAWEDGAPITAEDVVFSIKVAICPLLTVKAGASVFEIVQEVVTYPEDTRKLTLQMREKYIGNLFIMNSLYIIDKRFFDPEGMLEKFSIPDIRGEAAGLKVEEDSSMIAWANEFNDAKYGRDPEYMKGTSGPYKVEEWVPEQRIVLTRRENYWGKGRPEIFHQQHPDKIIFQNINDENSLELLIKQQEIDVATRVATPVFNRMLENPSVMEHYKLDFQQRDGFAYIALNNRPDGVAQKPIFSDKRVRYAFSHIVPIEEFITEFYHGRAARIHSPVSIMSKEYNQDIQPLPYSPDSAIKYLEQAGWQDSDGDQIRDKEIDGERIPLQFKLTFPAGSQSIEDMVQRLVLEGEKVGMQIVADPADFGVLQSMLPNHTYDAMMIGSSNSSLPFDFKQNWTTGSWLTGENFTGFGSPETDRLIEEARVELDPAKRKVMVDEIQAIIYEEQPVIFCFNTTNNMAIHRRFENSEMYTIRPYIMFNNLLLQE